MIKAIVFDFDGVIVNSEKIWIEAKINALKENNILIKKKINFNIYIGASSNFFFEKFIPKSQYSTKINIVKKTYKKIIKKKFFEIPKLNKKILSILKIKNIKFCIVSNNSKEYIYKSLKKYKISKYFKKKNIIALKNTKFQKPNPYGYLKIIKNLKFKSSEIIVIEDSASGIIAARKAKIKNIYRYNPLNLKKIKFTKNFNSFVILKKFITQFNNEFYNNTYDN